MISPIRLIAAAGALAALTGCGSDMEDAVTPAVASDERFETMTDPCLEKAARFSGQPLNNITVTGQSMTGGGPLLTLSAGGTPLSCRLDSDGSVTVFSEYAN